MHLSRRHLIAAASAFAASAGAGLAKTPRTIEWSDLIPPGTPYSQIIGEGEINTQSDTWLPVFDENATKLNDALHGAYIKMPGYMLPIDMTSRGVTSFLMVPYAGACIHVPPPPANQLVIVDSKRPWKTERQWDAVWVTGQIRHELQSTSLADIGYAMQADKIEDYVWE